MSVKSAMACSLRCESCPVGIVDQTDAPAQRRQPAVGVVVAQQQAILGPAGEHAIRLIDALGHQVVDEDADVRLAAIEDQAALALDLECRVDARPSVPERRPLRSRSCR